MEFSVEPYFEVSLPLVPIQTPKNQPDVYTPEILEAVSDYNEFVAQSTRPAALHPVSPINACEFNAQEYIVWNDHNPEAAAVPSMLSAAHAAHTAAAAAAHAAAAAAVAAGEPVSAGTTLPPAPAADAPPLPTPSEALEQALGQSRTQLFAAGTRSSVSYTQSTVPGISDLEYALCGLVENDDENFIEDDEANVTMSPFNYAPAVACQTVAGALPPAPLCVRPLPQTPLGETDVASQIIAGAHNNPLSGGCSAFTLPLCPRLAPAPTPVEWLFTQSRYPADVTERYVADMATGAALIDVNNMVFLPEMPGDLDRHTTAKPGLESPLQVAPAAGDNIFELVNADATRGNDANAIIRFARLLSQAFVAGREADDESETPLHHQIIVSAMERVEVEGISVFEPTTVADADFVSISMPICGSLPDKLIAPLVERLCELPFQRYTMALRANPESPVPPEWKFIAKLMPELETDPEKVIRGIVHDFVRNKVKQITGLMTAPLLAVRKLFLEANERCPSSPHFAGVAQTPILLAAISPLALKLRGKTTCPRSVFLAPTSVDCFDAAFEAAPNSVLGRKAFDSLGITVFERATTAATSDDVVALNAPGAGPFAGPLIGGADEVLVTSIVGKQIQTFMPDRYETVALLPEPAYAELVATGATLTVRALPIGALVWPSIMAALVAKARWGAFWLRADVKSGYVASLCVSREELNAVSTSLLGGAVVAESVIEMESRGMLFGGVEQESEDEDDEEMEDLGEL